MDKDYSNLKNECFKLMIDSGIKVKIHGDANDLARRLSEHLGENVHVSSLSNALSGYRKGKRSIQILEGLKAILSIKGDYTHQKANCN